MSKPGSKPNHPSPAMVFCGVDVSAATLAVAVEREDRSFDERRFANSAAGHKALIAWLGKHGSLARVSLESTGIYSMDVALALDRAIGIEVAVLNPKEAHRVAQSLRRSKTDKADAQALAIYSRKEDFVAWRAPTENQLKLRTLSRYIDGRTAECARDKNRLHAARGSAATPAAILADLERSLVALKHSIAALRREALAMVQADDVLRQRYELLLGMPGIAKASALQLLGELALLSPDMSVRQWVAQSGLDPVHHLSGSSVHKPSKISRAGNHHLRRILFLAALVASRHDAHMRGFYQALLGRHKAKMQALTALARKILHAIYGVLKTGTPYEGAKLFPQLQLHTS